MADPSVAAHEAPERPDSVYCLLLSVHKYLVMPGGRAHERAGRSTAGATQPLLHRREKSHPRPQDSGADVAVYVFGRVQKLHDRVLPVHLILVLRAAGATGWSVVSCRPGPPPLAPPARPTSRDVGAAGRPVQRENHLPVLSFAVVDHAGFLRELGEPVRRRERVFGCADEAAAAQVRAM